MKCANIQIGQRESMRRLVFKQFQTVFGELFGAKMNDKCSTNLSRRPTAVECPLTKAATPPPLGGKNMAGKSTVEMKNLL